MAQKTIALIICSTRKPRVCPAIATWLTTILSNDTPVDINLTTLDLASYAFPLSPSGQIIPAQISLPLPPSPYDDPIVNSWSQDIRGVNGFIFLTPQYNWSVPGVLKVAIDHLFHEWSGKPMMLVTYGGHGGGKSAAAMKEIWKGLRGGEQVGSVELSLAGVGIVRAIKEGVLDEEVRKAWEAAGKEKEVLECWEKLVGVLREKKEI